MRNQKYFTTLRVFDIIGYSDTNETISKQMTDEDLIITNASIADEGLYHCEAHNQIGVDVLEVYVEVKRRQWGSSLLHNRLLHFGLTIVVMFLLFLIVGSVVYHKFPQCVMYAS